MKKIIRTVVGFFPAFMQRLCADFYWWFECVIQWRRVRILEQGGMKKYEIDPSVSVDKECHILASGWSLNYSFKEIDRSESFLIGFNFSFLKCRDPDIHFIENASLSNDSFFHNSLVHYFGLLRFFDFNSSKLIFKNISEAKNSVKLISSMYGKRACFVRDRHFRFFGLKGVDDQLDRMLKEDVYLPQAVSSVISLIFFARFMGFKKIIIHGLDFGGPHFYGESLDGLVFGNGELDFDLKEVDCDSNPHKTALGENGVGVEVLLKLLKEKLSHEGVGIYSATRISPSSKLIGVDDGVAL